MSIQIIVLLEIVNINQDDTDGFNIRIVLHDIAQGIEIAAIEQAGKSIDFHARLQHIFLTDYALLFLQHMLHQNLFLHTFRLGLVGDIHHHFLQQIILLIGIDERILHMKHLCEVDPAQVQLQLLFDVILQTDFPHILQELFTALFILYVQQNVKDIIIESKIHTAVEMMMQLGGSKVIRNFLYLIASVKGVRQKQLTQQSHMQTKTLCLPLMQQRSIGSIYILGLIQLAVADIQLHEVEDNNQLCMIFGRCLLL